MLSANQKTCPYISPSCNQTRHMPVMLSYLPSRLSLNRELIKDMMLTCCSCVKIVLSTSNVTIMINSLAFSQNKSQKIISVVKSKRRTYLPNSVKSVEQASSWNKVAKKNTQSLSNSFLCKIDTQNNLLNVFYESSNCIHSQMVWNLKWQNRDCCGMLTVHIHTHWRK